MRTKEQAYAAFNWLSPKAFGQRFGGVGEEFVRDELIAKGRLYAINLNEGTEKRPEYRIPPSELRRLLRESATAPDLPVPPEVKALLEDDAA